MTEKERRALQRRRRETSTFWALVHTLGSLNLAVILLFTVAAAIAIATIMESKFDSKVAAYYIYNASWFNLWLLLLGLNLFCAALTRWPWQRKHIGFVITHAGIITLLIGAVIGRVFGFEAFVTLDKTKPPENRLYTKDNIVTVDTSAGWRGEMPIDTEMHPPSVVHPLTVPLDGSSLRLVIDSATENLQPITTLTKALDPLAPAGISLHFINAGMGQNVAANLVANDTDGTYDFFGLAKVLLVPSLKENDLIPMVEQAPARSPVASGPPRDETPFRETHLLFALHPESPVVDTGADKLSDYILTFQNNTLTVRSPRGPSQSWPLNEAPRVWTHLPGEAIYFRVAQSWLDFSLKGGQPVSLSDQPNNPAVLVQLTGPTKLLPPPEPQPSTQAPPLPQGLIMRIALAHEPGRMIYELERAGKIYARQVAVEGQSFDLGWSKWQARLDSVLPHAELHRDVEEWKGPVTPRLAGTLLPGIQAHLLTSDGRSGPSVWIPAGSSRPLSCPDDFAQVGFGQRTIPLSFFIKLQDFQVPRDEGTDTPANFISTLEFHDMVTGREVRDQAFMNSPAMFPGDFWRSLLGWNYKFSQANWDPQNLNQTTLQCLYDPGWPFKWLGSLGICLGIALMFYFIPQRSPQERAQREDSP